MITDYDVVIIGSGGGGAPIANRLVQAGKSVLVLDKGPLLKPQYQTENGVSDFKRDELFSTGPQKKIRIPELSNTGASYYSSHVEPDLNDEPHVYLDQDGTDKATIEGYTAQLVGGGTQLYGGVHLRFSPLDFQLRDFNDGRTDLQSDPNGDVQREVRNWPISYEQLEPYYVQVEELVGLNGTAPNQIKPFSQDRLQTPLDPNPISEFARVGMVALGQRFPNQGTPLQPYRTPLAVITEDHVPSGRVVPSDRETIKSGYVNRYGDPLGLKSSTWVSLLSPIQSEPNFELWPNCTVMSIESEGDRIAQIKYRDPSGDLKTLALKPGAILVVACSAIETVRLLQLSAREDSNFHQRIHQGLSEEDSWVGKYFLTHCFGGAEAVVRGVPAQSPTPRFDKSLSVDSDWAIDCCATEDFLRSNGLWAGAAIYNNTSDQALPLALGRTHGSQDLDTIWRTFDNDLALTGAGLINFLNNDFGTRLSVSFMANQVPLRTNRIDLHPTVTDKWGRPSAYIRKIWHSHDIYLMDVLAKQCEEVLILGGANANPDEIGEGGIYLAENALARIANHILGGARFGTDPNDSVLDVNCRAWQFDNLYVTDGSCMPTSGGANPTHTIEANAFRVADHLLTR